MWSRCRSGSLRSRAQIRLQRRLATSEGLLFCRPHLSPAHLEESFVDQIKAEPRFPQPPQKNRESSSARWMLGGQADVLTLGDAQLMAKRLQPARVATRHVRRGHGGSHTAPDGSLGGAADTKLPTQRQMNIKRRLSIRSAAFGVNGGLIQKKNEGQWPKKKTPPPNYFFFTRYLLHLPLTAGTLRLEAPSFHHRQLCQNWPDGTRRKIWNRSWTGGGGFGLAHVFIVSAHQCDSVPSK